MAPINLRQLTKLQLERILTAHEHDLNHNFIAGDAVASLTDVGALWDLQDEIKRLKFEIDRRGPNDF